MVSSHNAMGSRGTILPNLPFSTHKMLDVTRRHVAITWSRNLKQATRSLLPINACCRQVTAGYVFKLEKTVGHYGREFQILTSYNTSQIHRSYLCNHNDLRWYVQAGTWCSLVLFAKVTTDREKRCHLHMTRSQTRKTEKMKALWKTKELISNVSVIPPFQILVFCDTFVFLLFLCCIHIAFKD